MQSTGDKIEILIRAKGWTLQDFARHIKYDRSHFSRLLSKGKFSDRHFEKIATGLGIEKHVLLQYLEERAVGDGNMPAYVMGQSAPRLKPEDALAKAEEALVKADEEIRRLREQVVEMGNTNQRLLDLLEKSMTK